MGDFSRSPGDPEAAPGAEGVGSSGAPDSESEDSEPQTLLGQAFERLAQRVGRNQLVKLAAAGGDVRRAFADIPTRMRLVANETQLVLELIEDFRSGAYREVSWTTIAVASAAILYAVSPADVIPDAIPILGTFDDLAVVALAVRLIRKDLREYCRFKGYDTKDYFGS